MTIITREAVRAAVERAMQLHPENTPSTEK